MNSCVMFVNVHCDGDNRGGGETQILHRKGIKGKRRVASDLSEQPTKNANGESSTDLHYRLYVMMCLSVEHLLEWSTVTDIELGKCNNRQVPFDLPSPSLQPRKLIPMHNKLIRRPAVVPIMQRSTR